MKNYTVQYQKNTWDGIRNMLISANSVNEAEDKAREKEKDISIVRVFEQDYMSNLHTTKSFKKVPTPANAFKV